jgi:hypothetical protein
VWTALENWSVTASASGRGIEPIGDLVRKNGSPRRPAINPLGRAAQETPRLVRYRSAVGRLPNGSAIDHVNKEVVDAIAFPRELGVDTTGRCRRLSLRWRWKRWLVDATVTRE